MIERLTAGEGGVDVDTKTVFDLLLPMNSASLCGRSESSGPSSASSSGVVTSRGDIGSTSQVEALI